MRDARKREPDRRFLPSLATPSRAAPPSLASLGEGLIWGEGTHPVTLTVDVHVHRQQCNQCTGAVCMVVGEAQSSSWTTRQFRFKRFPLSSGPLAGVARSKIEDQATGRARRLSRESRPGDNDDGTRHARPRPNTRCHVIGTRHGRKNRILKSLFNKKKKKNRVYKYTSFT